MVSTELLAPAGDFDTALAAFAAGADAVYCGLADFSARAFAKNFSPAELDLLVRYAHAGAADRPPRRVYVTFNTLVDEDDFEPAVRRLAELAAIGPDGIIVQDLGVARIARRFFPELELHASTQLVAHNLEGVLALKELGFRRVVLARELSLPEIDAIARRCGALKVNERDGRAELELEVFIHGALCYSISGLCLYGAMEKERSGNRGQCPYCCRQSADDRHYPFSMKDLRLGADVRKLVAAGVSSLKIEGRMKTPLYVSSVTKYYRGMLDQQGEGRGVTVADLETVFSRRTTELYLNGRGESPIDPESLGHRGTPIGTVKRLTKDRDGLSWLRFHTTRALEKHDGLQFDALTEEGRHFGFGIAEMRQAISRVPVFEVAAGTDVEVLLPESETPPPIGAGDVVYCSMSNAVKRAFPSVSCRPSDYPGGTPIAVKVTLAAEALSAEATAGELRAKARVAGKFEAARDSSRTCDGVRKALAKLGGTAYALASLEVVDPDGRFAPMSLLNDLRRDLVEALDAERIRRDEARLNAALDAAAAELPPSAAELPRHGLRIRLGQKVPAGEWEEIAVLVTDFAAPWDAAACPPERRLALPVWNGELTFGHLRNFVKARLREGYRKWEASDLATLRLLKAVGVEDVSADWSLYAFNASALAALTELGAKRFVASPENNRENLAYLAESGYPVVFLAQQSTPLFLSLHEPAGTPNRELAVFKVGEVWVTTRVTPRVFTPPAESPSRIDLSWDPL